MEIFHRCDEGQEGLPQISDFDMSKHALVKKICPLNAKMNVRFKKKGGPSIIF
jgi:hypothetical protein